jgi:hypothetical protein
MGRSVNRTAKRWHKSGDRLERQRGAAPRAWGHSPKQVTRCGRCGQPTSRMGLRRIDGQDVGPCCQEGKPDSS